MSIAGRGTAEEPLPDDEELVQGLREVAAINTYGPSANRDADNLINALDKVRDIARTEIENARAAYRREYEILDGKLAQFIEEIVSEAENAKGRLTAFVANMAAFVEKREAPKDEQGNTLPREVPKFMLQPRSPSRNGG